MHVESITAVEEDGSVFGSVSSSAQRLGEVQALALAVAIALTLLTITLTGIVIRPLAAVVLLALVSCLPAWAVFARWRRLRAAAARRLEALKADVAGLRSQVQRLDVERRALRAELAAERARRESDRVARTRSSSSSSSSDRRRASSDSGRLAPQKVGRLARAR